MWYMQYEYVYLPVKEENRTKRLVTNVEQNTDVLIFCNRCTINYFWYDIYDIKYTNKSTQRAQTSADAKIQLKVIWDSNPDFRINPDPGMCRICPKMSWMHYLVGVSHFTTCGTNRPLIVWEMLTNKGDFYPLFRNGEKMKKWSTREPRSPPKVKTSRGSSLACQVWSTSVSAFVSYPVYSITEWQTEQ